MIENNEENRKKLAHAVSDGMSFKDMVDLIKLVLEDRYKQDDDAFKDDLRWNVDEDGNIYE